MRCTRCDGKGQVLDKWPIYECVYAGYGEVREYVEYISVVEPCPDCMGHGIIHCCEGEVACPMTD